MAAIKLYGISNCDKCRAARRRFTAAGSDFQFIDYRKQPVSARELARWAETLGGWEALVNKSSRTWRQLDAADRRVASEADGLALLLNHITLIKRPVVVLPDGTVYAGGNEALYARLLGQA